LRAPRSNPFRRAGNRVECFVHSPREAVGRGRGWGVPRQTRCQRSKLIDPPPPTPPRHAQRRVEGGEIPRMTSRSRRVFSREVLSFLPALFKERAQGKPGARCTRGLACKKGRRAHTSIQVQRKQSGLPCAMGLTASFELSPVIGLSCHRHRRR